MSTTFDVIVVGLGAMGSATVHQLAKNGHRVLGIDRFAPPHAMGSSHGRSRIIREAYFEDPRYVPLVQRAYECWTALEAETGATLFRQTGGLMIGRPETEIVSGARLSAELHSLTHELLTAEQLQARFPAFRLSDDTVGVLEPRAGVLDPERAITAALAAATARGAAIRCNEPMLSWTATPSGVEVRTANGVYHAAKLVLTVGAWTTSAVRELALPLVPQRNVLYWFTAANNPDAFGPDRFPIFLHEFAPGCTWYGFPDTGDGVKVALHHWGDDVNPDAMRRTVEASETEFVRSLLRQFLPDADGPLRETAVCMYTNAPDGHFVIDTHPDHAAVTVASPCSGHGFKFSSAIGELLAQMATDQPPRFDISLFSLSRFART
jgi:sarcosine oxidase